MKIDDYDALLKVVSLLKLDKSFEKKLLKLHLLAIDECEYNLGFNSRQLSDSLRELLESLTEVKLRQIKYLFNESPPFLGRISSMEKWS